MDFGTIVGILGIAFGVLSFFVAPLYSHYYQKRLVEREQAKRTQDEERQSQIQALHDEEPVLFATSLNMAINDRQAHQLASTLASLSLMLLVILYFVLAFYTPESMPFLPYIMLINFFALAYLYVTTLRRLALSNYIYRLHKRAFNPGWNDWKL